MPEKHDLTISGPAPLSMWYAIVPLLFFAAIAYFTPGIDLELSRYFYDPITNTFWSPRWAHIIRHWAIIPAMFIAVAASVFLILSYFVRRWKKWRPHALLLILPMALGAGIITHNLLKDRWGRPRPRQIENFGGTETFRPFYKPNLSVTEQPLKSFPCGHCTMGFYFFAVALLGRRLRCQWLFFAGLALALVLGVALSAARIAQGGHFLSDTLATAILMWVVSMATDWLLFSRETK
jgi:membrane-associated PAP2 superfamily phosphatase